LAKTVKKKSIAEALDETAAYVTEPGRAGKVIDDFEAEIKDMPLAGVTFDAHAVTDAIITFGKILTGVALYDYQYKTVYRIIYSVITLEGATLTMLFSRQSGKSESLAFVIDALTVLLPALAKLIPDLDQFKDGIKIGLFAPQSDQVNTTQNRAMARLGSDNAAEIMGDEELDVWLLSRASLKLSNGSYMLGQVASKQSKIESKTYDLVICEEAQDMDSYIVQKSIEPMVSATGGTVVKSGTTGRSKNDFWYEIQTNKNKSRKEKDPRLHHHLEFNYKAVIADKRKQYEKDGKLFHLNYEKDILRKRAKWGETAEAFKLGYGLVWAVESGMLITDKQLEKLVNRKKGFGEILEEDFIIAGLDIAKSPASTVLTIGRVVDNNDDEFAPPKKEVLRWLELEETGYEEQHHILLDAIIEYDVKRIYADYTGVGKPVVDRLIAACGEYVEIIPYAFSTPSKSEMWYSLLNDIDTARIIIPGNRSVRDTMMYQRFTEQMLNMQKSYSGAYLVAEKSPGYLDDYVDSLGLMCLAANIEIPEELEEDGINPFSAQMVNSRINRKNNSWA
jgi:hypothetical protein